MSNSGSNFGFNYNSAEESYGPAENTQSEPEQTFFDDLMAEVDAEPTGGAGGPNNMFFRYNQLAKEYNTVDKNMAERIREHGKEKVKETFPNYQEGGRKKTYRKRRSTKKRNTRKTRSRRY
jgi:hypothetical protein